MKSILIVDDSPTELAVVHQSLESSGYALTNATSGEEALELISKVKPDLVVIDIILPGKNGFQVCRDLKAKPDTADIKVVLLSTKSQDSDKFWGEKQGADAYLTKPFDPDELRATVAELVL
ncbi:MAG: response regulator transcription factor [Myxococcota bacterium]